MARTTAVAVVLLIVFGALFASADAAFADLLGSLTPDVSIGDRVRTVARTTAVAVVLLIVFGALFASADAAFADLLGSLTPDVSI
ncbi:DUF4153 domain-containing protein, partial [Streptomyces sp. wa22]|uniref:DUF4153 domain-containing protein n=1 Tax=Streptomyces sp. wa22 TaxID=1828244 RepID=UPI002905DA2C